MEERRITRRCSGCARLLIFIFIYSVLALKCFSLEASFNVSSWDLFVGDTFVVSIEIKNKAPKDVDAQVTFASEHLALIGQKKEQRLISGTSNRQKVSEFATVFELEYKVEKTGSAEIGPFIIVSKEASVILPKVFVVVQEVESQELAFMYWSTTDDVYQVGVPVSMHLNAHFAGTLDSYSVEVPENMLLEKTDVDRRETLEQSSAKSNETPQLIASYSMILLSSGEHCLPEARMTFFDTQSRFRQIQCATKTIQVLPQYQEALEIQLKSDASLAFVEQYKSEKPIIDASLYVQELVSLRRAEYTSLFPAKIRATRQALEQDLLLLDNANVPLGAWKKPLLFLTFVMWLITIFFYVVFYRKKEHKKTISILCCCALLFSSIFVYMYIQDRNQYAVVENCIVFQIPEVQAAEIEHLGAGTVVMPIKKVSNWYLIQTKKGITGWLLSDFVHIYTGSL